MVPFEDNNCNFCNKHLKDNLHFYMLYISYERFHKSIQTCICPSCFDRECRFFNIKLNITQPIYSCYFCAGDVQQVLRSTTRFYKVKKHDTPDFIAYICPDCSDHNLGLQ